MKSTSGSAMASSFNLARSIPIWIAALLFFVGLSSAVQAVDTTWIFDGDGNWNEPDKWSNGEPIDATFDVFIDDGDSAPTVTLNASRAVGSLTISADDIFRFETLTSNTIELAVANDVSNFGTVEVTSTGVNGGTLLSLGTGTFINQSTGVLRYSNSHLGVHNFNGNLQNFGSVEIVRSMTFNKPGGIYANEGQFVIDNPGEKPGFQPTVTIASGGTLQQNGGTLQANGQLRLSEGSTLQVTGGTFVVGQSMVMSADSQVKLTGGVFKMDSNGGSISGGTFIHNGGTIDYVMGVISSSTFTYQAGTINGTLLLRDSYLQIASAATTPVSFAVQGDSTFSGNVQPGQQLTLKDTRAGEGLSSANGFTNGGTIFADRDYSALGVAYFTVANGALVNSPTGDLRFRDSASLFDNHWMFNGDLTNYGMVRIESDTTFEKAGAQYANYGQFTISGTHTIDNGATFNQNGGALDVKSFFNIAHGSTLNIAGGQANVNFATTISSGSTVNLTGGQLTTTGSLSFSGSSVLNLLPGGVLNMAANVNGVAFTQSGGALNCTSGKFSGTYKYVSGPISGVPILNGATLIIESGANGFSTFLFEQNNNLSLVDGVLAAGESFTSRSTNVSTTALTSAAGFTNHGSIVVDGTNSGTSGLTISNGTIDNAANGLLHFQTGGTGSRAFSGNLTNDGTILVDRSTAFTKAGASSLNRGWISVAAAQTLSITGGGMFDQVAGTLDIAGTVIMTGGTFHYIGGAITGAPVISGGTLAIDADLTRPYAFALEGNSTLSLADGQLRPGQSLTVRHISTGTQGTTAAATINNFGSIYIGGTSSGITSLTLTTGRLYNEAGGLLNFQAGGTGSRSLLTELTNYGTVIVDQATTFGKTAGVHENHGQFTVNAAGTLSIPGGGVFEQADGNLDIAGSANFSGITMKYLGGTITGTVQLTSSALQIGPTSGNSGSFLLVGDTTFTGNIRAGQTLNVQPAMSSTQGLTSASGFTNDGSILLAGSSSGVTRLSITSGTLVNGPTGLLHFQTGGTGTRSLLGDLTNSGAVLVERGTAFSKAGGAYNNSGQFTVATGQTLSLTGGGTFSQADGTLDVQGTFNMSGGSFKYLGGNITGTPSLSGVALTIGTIAPVNFSVTGNGTLVLPNSILADDQVITIQNSTLTSANGFANNGSIQMNATASSSVSGMEVQNGTLVNNADGLLHFQNGSGTRSFKGNLTNYGTVIIDQATTFNKSGGVYSNSGQFTVNQSDSLAITAGGVFEQLAGTLDLQGPVSLSNLRYLGGALVTRAGVLLQMNNGSLTIGPNATSPVDFMLEGNSTLAGSIQAGQEIIVRNSSFTTQGATSPNSLTNNGSIFVLAASTGAAHLTITEGALVNGATGVLRFEPGNNALTFNGDLANNGTVLINKSTTFSKFAGNYVNSGTFSVASGQNLILPNGGAFEQAAGTLALTGSMAMTAVAFKEVEGTINLNAKGSITLTGGEFEHMGGMFNVAGNMVMTSGVFNQTGGDLNVSGRMSIVNGGTFNYLGGTITGAPGLIGSTLANSTLFISAAAANPASFIFSGNCRLVLESGTLPAGFTVSVGAFGSSGEFNADGFINRGSIVFNPTAGTQFLKISTGTLVNGPTGLVHFGTAGGDGRFTGDLLNQGTVLLDSLTSIFNKTSGYYLNAGQFSVTNNLSITNGGNYKQIAGSTLINGSMTVAVPIQLTGGQLTGRGTIVAPVENLAAIVAPGDTLGTLTIQGNYTQHESGVLDIELGGADAGQFDVLNILGTASLDGTLNVSLLAGFMPASGTSFDILNWSSLSGRFSEINLPPLATGLFWDQSELYSNGTLSITNHPPGDFDANGVVDGVDFSIWQTNFPISNGHTLSTGDADGDGDVDGADFIAWQTNYGTTATAAPVPEPAGFLFAAVGLLLWGAKTIRSGGASAG